MKYSGYRMISARMPRKMALQTKKILSPLVSFSAWLSLILRAGFLTVIFSSPPYHSEFSEKRLEVVLAIISSTTLITELNRPMAVAYA